MTRVSYQYLGKTQATNSTAAVEPVGNILRRMEVTRMRSLCEECTSIISCHRLGSAIKNCERLIELEIKAEMAEREAPAHWDAAPAGPIRPKRTPRFDFSMIESKRAARRKSEKV